MRYDTPPAVASLLARHAPFRLSALLDPAAGTGVLVRPFLERNPGLRATCIDIDSTATKALRKDLTHHPKARVISGDFLKWNSDALFDCVVMNPPFACRKEDLVKMSIPSGDGEEKTQITIASEMAFVCKALGHLRPGGRLIAILPASIISSDSGKWLREVLTTSGAVKMVHELPKHTFVGIEAKTFVVVYEHGKTQTRIALRNHRLRCPDEMIVAKRDFDKDLRFDYEFYDASKWYLRLRSLSEFGWVKFGDIADLWRGEVESPIKDQAVLHTTNFRKFQPTEREKKNWKNPVRMGDLIVHRVGRNCGASWLPYLRRSPARCSDCLFVVRPKEHCAPLSLLFALRVLLASGKGPQLVQHGIGAAYLTGATLRDLWVPYGLSAEYPVSFHKFVAALRSRDWTELQRIERRVQSRMNRRLERRADAAPRNSLSKVKSSCSE